MAHLSISQKIFSSCVKTDCKLRAGIIEPARRVGSTATSEKSLLAKREMERQREADVSLNVGFQPTDARAAAALVHALLPLAACAAR